MQIFILEKAEVTLILAPHIFFSLAGTNCTETQSY